MGGLRDWVRRAFSGERPPNEPWPPPELRVTLIGTDYAPARTASSYRAPDPYSGFAAPPGNQRRAKRSRRRRSTAPVQSALPWGALPPSTQEPTTPTPVPTTPTPRTRPPRKRAPRTRRVPGRIPTVLGLTLAVIAVVIAGQAIWMQVSEPDDADLAWTLEPDDVAPGTYAGFAPVDGTATGTVLTTTAGWVVRLDDDLGYSFADPDLLAGVDPDTGEVAWSRTLPDSVCTQTVPGDDLVCLARPDGDDTPLQLLALDPATGDLLGDPVPTDLEAVPATLSVLGDGLVTLGIDRQFTALDLDGATLWTRPLGVTGWNPDYQVPDVVQYPDAVVVRMPIDDGTVHLRADGELRRLECPNLVATPEAWICEESYDWTIGYAPDGSELWREDWSDLHLVSAYQRTIPVALAEVGRDVALLEPTTAYLGSTLTIDGDGGRSFVGDAEHPVVVTDDSIALVDTVGAGIEWETRVDDEYLNIATGGVVDGVLVVDGEMLHGLDLATGDQLWVRASPPGDVWVHDGAVLVLGSELSRVSLP